MNKNSCYYTDCHYNIEYRHVTSHVMSVYIHLGLNMIHDKMAYAQHTWISSQDTPHDLKKNMILN